MYDAIILAGGKGTRLSPVSGDLPKPMVTIAGVPMIEHQLRLCLVNGFKNILISVGYKKDKIINYFKNGAHLGVNIEYIIEEQELGTGGALQKSLNWNMQSDFLVLYGDIYYDIDLRKFYLYHLNKEERSFTALVHPNDHPYDSDIVEMDDQGYIQGIRPYPHSKNLSYSNLVNAALYVVNRNFLQNNLITATKFDIAKDMIPKYLRQSIKLCGYRSSEYTKDAGTPERLKKIELDISKDVPKRLSRFGSRPAVFLDRDGTLNHDTGHISSPENLTLIDGVGEAIKKLNNAGILAVLITNQPVVARGEVDEIGLKKIHNKLEMELGNFGAYLDMIYYCPHHPDKGFAGERVELKYSCECRKPQIGMIEQACSELGISKDHACFIGDTTIDLETARRASVSSILVRTGFSGKDAKYSLTGALIVDNLNEAVGWAIAKLI